MRVSRNERGISLVMASSIMLMIFSMSMVSLTMVTSSSVMTRAIYSQSVVQDIAEDGPVNATFSLLEDAEDGFTELLAKEGSFFKDKLEFPLFGNVAMAVSIRDNDDLDDSTGFDVDKTFILHSEGYIVDDESKSEADQVQIAATTLEVLVRYIGNDDEYAQETGGAKSNSNFASETDVSDF